MLKIINILNSLFIMFIFVALNLIIMNDNFDDYAINIDSDVVNQDFDNIDLYGDKYIEEENDNFGNEIQYE